MTHGDSSPEAPGLGDSSGSTSESRPPGILRAPPPQANHIIYYVPPLLMIITIFGICTRNMWFLDYGSLICDAC